jgi:protein SCO1
MAVAALTQRGLAIGKSKVWRSISEMSTIQKIRLALWALAALAAVFAVSLFMQQRSGQSSLLPDIKLGVPFTLKDQNNAVITEAAMQGAPHAVFFGFTHCPEICPTTLFEMSGYLETLGEAGKDLKVFFVSVDPARDTPEILSTYLSAFPRVTGITGDEAGIAALAQSWKVYFKRTPLDDGGYTMDHTASVFLVRADGSLQGTIGYGENPDIALEKLKRLVNQ